jgi:hypothetical protein
VPVPYGPLVMKKCNILLGDHFLVVEDPPCDRDFHFRWLAAFPLGGRD